MRFFLSIPQISQEIEGALDFLKSVYETFGFSFELKLSTRPEGYLGELEVWNQAEKQLAESLDKFGQKWTLNPGDGAFYGPKIDITIQVDFPLHIRSLKSFLLLTRNSYTRRTLF